jgi:hypothetical protein
MKSASTSAGPTNAMFSAWKSVAQLCTAAVAFGCSPALSAQELLFTGRWVPDIQAAAPGAYAVLTIEAARMSWHDASMTSPGCSRDFALQPEKPGTEYADGRGTRFVAGTAGSLPTYLLKVTASTCGGKEDAIRISFPRAYDRAHMELIQYVQGKPVSARRFHRALAKPPASAQDGAAASR